MENSEQGAFAMCNEKDHQAGLTKREYFAGLALQGILANHNYCLNQNYISMNIVHKAISMADELIRQL